MPIRITNDPRNPSIMFISNWGDNWRAIATFIQTLPNSRWMEADQVWKTPIDNMASIKDFMEEHCPGEKRFCSEECATIIKSYFKRLEYLINIKATAAVDLTAIYPLLNLEKFTKTGGQPGEYQKIGAAWLAAIGRGVLADAYGVGKTVQGIMAALILKVRGLVDHVYIVGTKAASEVWEKEILKFSKVKGIRVQGKDRWKQYGSEFFTITTYTKASPPTQKVTETESQFKDRMRGCDFLVLKEKLAQGRTLFIVDEFHKCSRASTKRTRACKELAAVAPYRFGISADGGFQNEVRDLHNTYGVIDKNILGNWEDFRRNCLQSQWGGGWKLTDKGRAWVAMRTSNFMLRRTRDQIGIERKDIQTQVIFVELSDEERRVYDKADDGAFSLDKDGNLQECRLVDITRMRQACLTPWMLDKKHPRISSKLDRLEDIVEELVADGNKVILYSYYDDWFPLIEERFGHFGILTFSGKARNLQVLQDKFNEQPKYKIALTTDAAAESVSLHGANVLVKLTIPWNPSRNGQIDGRMDRMLQEKDMLAITLAVKDSYEEDMLEILDTKGEEFEALVAQAGEMGLRQLIYKKRKGELNHEQSRLSSEDAKSTIRGPVNHDEFY